MKHFFGDAFPVIAYPKRKTIISAVHSKIHFSSARVADDVREGLLDNSEHGDRQISIDFDIARPDLQHATDAGPFAELRYLPFDGSYDAQVVEDIRP
jgi:hypothetical protein